MGGRALAKSLVTVLGASLRRSVPTRIKARMSGRLKARVRALLGIEPWPDLAVRHPLFRTPQYRALRDQARPFDVEKLNRPVLERGHQAAYVVARWFEAARMRTAFHVGYANGRYLFYLSRMGIACGGTDLPAGETEWVDVPADALDASTRRRMLRVDFFHLDAELLRSVWSGPDETAPHLRASDGGTCPVDVLFSEATFETLLPWRTDGVSVASYLAMGARAREALMHERFPGVLAGLASCVRNMIFIEPEPSAGGAGAVFDACGRRVTGLDYSVWEFRPPFDTLFRLSPGSPTRQAVYAVTRDAELLGALRCYASRR